MVIVLVFIWIIICFVVIVLIEYFGDVVGDMYGFVCFVMVKEMVGFICVDVGFLIGWDLKIEKLMCYDGFVYFLIMVLMCIGKGVGMIIFNFFIVDWFVICIDFKGENVKIVGCVCLIFGLVYIIDFFGVIGKFFFVFNLFDIFDFLSLDVVEDVSIFVDVFVFDVFGMVGEVYWNEEVKVLVMGFIFMVVFVELCDCRYFGMFCEYLILVLDWFVNLLICM